MKRILFLTSVLARVIYLFFVKSRREKIHSSFCGDLSKHITADILVSFLLTKNSRQNNLTVVHSVIIIIIMFTSSFVTATTSSLSSETSSSRFARLHSRPGKRSTLITHFSKGKKKRQKFGDDVEKNNT